MVKQISVRRVAMVAEEIESAVRSSRPIMVGLAPGGQARKILSKGTTKPKHKRPLRYPS